MEEYWTQEVSEFNSLPEIQRTLVVTNLRKYNQRILLFLENYARNQQNVECAIITKTMILKLHQTLQIQIFF